MEFHRHSPCVRVQRQGVAGRLPRHGGPRCGGGFEPLGFLPFTNGVPAGIRCDLWSFQTVEGAATRVCEIILLGYRPCGRGGFEPPTSRLAAGAPTMESREHSPREGCDDEGWRTHCSTSELQAPGGMVDPTGLEPATDGVPPAFVTKHDRPWRRRCARGELPTRGRRRVSGTPRSGGGCTPALHSPWIQPGGRGVPGQRRRSGAPCAAGCPARLRGPMESRRHSSQPRPDARSPGRPAPIRQSTIRSISSTQRSAPDPASAKAAIASNTASEKPPTLRMSARSCACVVA